MPPPIAALLPPAELAQLRTALEPFTVDAVHELLGPVGGAAHARGDLAGVARALDGAGRSRVADLVRLFLLGVPLPEPAARAALHPLDPVAAERGGIVERSGGEVRARLELRPYSEDGDTARWWVVSDFGADVRPVPLRHDHVLGIGPASLLLAQAVPRAAAGSALDVGTGSGVQALHLGRHAERVVATDVSERALRFAATTAGLSDQRWELRSGSLLEPVAGERFDLVVANPPFVISAGGEHVYRDGGLPGDAVSERLLRGVGSQLEPGGRAVLLANWIVPRSGDWRDRVRSWLAGSGCDAWVWQREVAGLGEYVTLWLRDAGEQPGTPRWTAAYDAWVSYLEQAGAAAIGMGLAFLWRTDRARPVVTLEDVPQAVQQPVGAYADDWVRRGRWLADATDDTLLITRLAPSPDLVRTDELLLGAAGWTPALSRLRLLSGMRWELEADEAIASLVAGVAVAPDLMLPLNLLAGTTGADLAQVTAAVLPVVRDLIGRGFLIPEPLLADAFRDRP